VTEVKQQASMVGAVREKSMDPDEVDRLIERRAKDKSPKDAANEREAIWKASEAARRQNAQSVRRMF
jgi:transcription initiation factor TFIIIB Brf1 subunit/transcription initiation factor TFIIB